MKYQKRKRSKMKTKNSKKIDALRDSIVSSIPFATGHRVVTIRGVKVVDKEPEAAFLSQN
jgi:hypothetical protein